MRPAATQPSITAASNASPLIAVITADEAGRGIVLPTRSIRRMPNWLTNMNSPVNP